MNSSQCSLSSKERLLRGRSICCSYSIKQFVSAFCDSTNRLKFIISICFLIRFYDIASLSACSFKVLLSSNRFIPPCPAKLDKAKWGSLHDFVNAKADIDCLLVLKVPVFQGPFNLSLDILGFDCLLLVKLLFSSCQGQFYFYEIVRSIQRNRHDCQARALHF